MLTFQYSHIACPVYTHVLYVYALYCMLLILLTVSGRSFMLTKICSVLFLKIDTFKFKWSIASG